MTQLELFHGPHLPLMRCLAALEAGDVGRAREALAAAEPGSPMATDRQRLAAIEARLARAVVGGSCSPQEVHVAFEAALGVRALPCASERSASAVVNRGRRILDRRGVACSDT